MWWPRQRARIRPGTVQRECRRIIRAMPVPQPFSMSVFVANIEKVRGRRIRLVGMPDDVPGHSGACGLWVRHRQQSLDLILYVGGATGFQRRKIIFHELCHLWCEDGVGVQRGRLTELFPGMPAELVEELLATGQVVARGAYDTHEEVRAETLADLLHHETLHSQTLDDVTLNNLDESLSRPIAGPRRRGLPHD